jgi:hypothetical protein
MPGETIGLASGRVTQHRVDEGQQTRFFAFDLGRPR